MQIVLPSKNMSLMMNSIENAVQAQPDGANIIISAPHPDDYIESAIWFLERIGGKTPEGFVFEADDIDNTVVTRYFMDATDSGNGCIIATAYPDYLPEEVKERCCLVELTY